MLTSRSLVGLLLLVGADTSISDSSSPAPLTTINSCASESEAIDRYGIVVGTVV